jgi:hypothetical protein
MGVSPMFAAQSAVHGQDARATLRAVQKLRCTRMQPDVPIGLSFFSAPLLSFGCNSNQPDDDSGLHPIFPTR